MSQSDVEGFLREQRKKTAKWFSAKEVREALTKEGHSNGTINGVYDDLYKLTAFGHIEFKGEGLWKHKKLFRAKV